MQKNEYTFQNILYFFKEEKSKYKNDIIKFMLNDVEVITSTESASEFV